MADLLLEETVADGVILLTLNRPDKRNALSNPLIAALATSLHRLQDDDDARCVVLTGAGKAFCAGADISEMESRGIMAIDNPARVRDWGVIEDFRKPIVSAVEGYAFGGGHELAMCTDFIIAADNARFGQPEINLGILPGDGATQRLTRIAGKNLAMKMMLTGAPIGATEALAAGLVAELVEPGTVLARAIALATEIAEKHPVGAAMVKHAVKAAYETNLSAGLETERQAIRLAFARGSHVEGMRKFLGKG